MNKAYICIFDTGNIVTNPVLPDNILNHCNQYNVLDKRNISLSNYHNLSLKLKELYDIDIKDLYFTDKGKPMIQGINISLSHSKDYYGFVISDNPVGFDIEELIEDRRFDLSSKILTEAEKDEFNKTNDKSLFLTAKWCLKEALGKLQGTGINSNILKMETNDYCLNRIDNSIFVITPNCEDIQIYYNSILMR